MVESRIEFTDLVSDMQNTRGSGPAVGLLRVYDTLLGVISRGGGAMLDGQVPALPL